MNKNCNHYDFLFEIDADLYDCVMRIENLYANDFYESVPNASRMFMECLIDKLCEKKKIKPVKHNDYFEGTNYSATMKMLFNSKFSLQPEIDLYNEVLQDFWKDVSEGSHYKNLYKNVNELKEINNEILFYIHDICVWFYSRNSKNYKHIPNYELPIVVNFKDKYNEILSENEALKNDYDAIAQENEDYWKKINDLKNKLNYDSGKQNSYKTEQLIQNYDNLKYVNEKLRKDCSELRNSIHSLQVKYNLLKLAQNNANKIETEIKPKTEIPNYNSKLRADILTAIKQMTSIGAWASKNTIKNFLNGIHFNMCNFYEIDKLEHWGIYKEQTIDIVSISNIIGELIKSKHIKTNSKGFYEIN